MAVREHGAPTPSFVLHCPFVRSQNCVPLHWLSAVHEPRHVVPLHGCDPHGMGFCTQLVVVPLQAPVGVATAFGGVPAQKLENDLRRLKQILETGEVVHSTASVHQGPHPARPSANPAPEFPRNEGERVNP